MKTTLTITSKRQLTIPRKVWDALELEGVRHLEADVEDGVLHLRKADFAGQMQSFWNKTAKKVQGQVSDASIRRASHRARARKQL
jgi:bifunctional DNA-binding transcriptional regulator/antitoxin component of YhaV-PrlF toxin-antitoxin module